MTLTLTTAPGITIISGDTEQVRDAFFGPQQHDEHMRGYRFELYMRDQRRGFAAMREEARRMIAAARALQDAREQFQAAAE